MAQLEPRMVQIKISIGSAKLEKLLELMPDYEKDGQNTTPIYWAIQQVINGAIAAKAKESEQRPSASNRDYLNIRRN